LNFRYSSREDELNLAICSFRKFIVFSFVNGFFIIEVEDEVEEELPEIDSFSVGKSSLSTGFVGSGSLNLTLRFELEELELELEGRDREGVVF